MKNLTFKELVRQNTGMHMCDSGGANGRHWQRPAIKKDSWLSFYEYNDGKFDVNATVNLVSFLNAHLTIDKKLTMKLRKAIDESNESIYYSGAAEIVAELTGLKVINSDNSYNHENDLSQNFQFSILSTDNDWYYNNESLVVLETHNGADIRGGYSDYVVCRFNGEAYGFLDQVCGFYITEGKDADGNELTFEECQSLCERWDIGYSSYPASMMNKDVKRVLTKENKSGEYNKLKVELNSGHVVTIVASPRLDY